MEAVLLVLVLLGLPLVALASVLVGLLCLAVAERLSPLDHCPAPPESCPQCHRDQQLQPLFRLGHLLLLPAALCRPLLHLRPAWQAVLDYLRPPV